VGGVESGSGLGLHSGPLCYAMVASVLALGNDDRRGRLGMARDRACGRPRPDPTQRSRDGTDLCITDMCISGVGLCMGRSFTPQSAIRPLPIAFTRNLSVNPRADLAGDSTWEAR